MSAFTFYFEEIIPDYDTWKSIIEQNNIVDYTNVTQQTFDKYCYNILRRHFNHCDIRYSDPYSFLNELVNVYENKFKQFLKEKEIIDSIYNLTNKEIEVLNESITNMANNPNEEPEDPLKPLNFISAQTFQQNKSNKIKAYLEALNNIPSLNIYKFLNEYNEYELSFNDLFMNVQPNVKYYY